MTNIRHEAPADFAGREALLNRAFGKTRKRKTSERLREGREPSDCLAFTAVDAKGRLIGTLRMWDVVAGSAGPALLLGPLAVDCKHQNQGIGAVLMKHALAQARSLGHAAVILVGDAPYYSRVGFSTAPVRDLHLPGPVERARFLGLELTPGSLDGAEGLVAASGRLVEAERKAA